MKIPIRTKLTVISGDRYCKKCHMRLYPDQEHTEEICVVAQVMEHDDRLGWSISEKVGIGVVNSRGLKK